MDYKEQVSTTTTVTQDVTASLTPTQNLMIQGAVSLSLQVPAKAQPKPVKEEAEVIAAEEKAEPVDKTSSIIVNHIKKFDVSDETAKRYAEYIIEYAKLYDHDPLWLTAMIDVESNFDPTTVSGHGAIGLMQILPRTARAFDVDPAKLKDPKVNIELGAKYLRYLVDRFDKDLGTVAYNQGEGNVAKGKYRTWYLKKVKEAFKSIDTTATSF